MTATVASAALRNSGAVERPKARLDQWLWFARFVKSRSLAARLCVSGAVAVNGITADRGSHGVRIGDTVVLAQGGWQRTVKVVALGVRRGPAPEARTLYEEAAPASPLRGVVSDWAPLLADDDVTEGAAASAEPI